MKKADYFFKPGNVGFITAVGNSGTDYLRSVAMRSSVTYANGHIVMARLEKLGLVSAERRGRMKLISLTPKGNEIYKCLVMIFSIIKSSS
jgi:DNA-binding MarR family transcriptional regulator